VIKGLRMEKHLKQLPEEILNLIYLCRDIAKVLGLNAYLIGGFVRDLILEVKNFDLDIAVEGDGIKFADALALKLKAKLVRHRRFGTATVMVNLHLKVDITSTRKEFYPEPGCLPVVNQGTLKDDLFRRDFTINTLAIAISGRNFGKLLDLFRAKEDIKTKKIRILHNLSFIDDPTRILRAIRFEQRYHFKIEPHTLKCLKKAMKLKMLSAIEPQRLRDEIILILKEDCPLRQIKRIRELVSFDFVKPGLKIPNRTLALFDAVQRQLYWFRHKLVLRRHLDFWLVYFMALIDHLTAQEALSLCNKFVFRKGETKRILTYMKQRSKIIQELSQVKSKPSKIFHLLEPLSYEVIILLKAKARNRIVQKHIEDFFHIYNGTDISVSGYDLKDMGVIPGPHYQKIFHKILNAKLDGEVRTKKEELDLVKKIKTL
jgi:tRNA nucleotidyltransferase (CCA-adding enzyme)